MRFSAEAFRPVNSSGNDFTISGEDALRVYNLATIWEY